MKTFKKRDIKKYKPVIENKPCACDLEEEVIDEEEVIEEEEVIDELVNGSGGEISGDEKNVNNSEIRTAPQNTTDQFNAMAIQPNRYLYGVTGSAYSSGTRGGTMENVAKDKMFKLLEEIGTPISNDMSDINNNGFTDIKELSQNVASKLKILISTVEKNNLNSEQVTMIINTLLDSLIPRLDENGIATIKAKFNA